MRVDQVVGRSQRQELLIELNVTKGQPFLSMQWKAMQWGEGTMVAEIVFSPLIFRQP
jgi:hypothetical protein